MVQICVDDLGLEYPLLERRTLGGRVPATSAPAHSVGGHVSRSGKHGKHVVALDGVSFRLSAGDRLALIGGNGAGNTAKQNGDATDSWSGACMKFLYAGIDFVGANCLTQAMYNH